MPDVGRADPLAGLHLLQVIARQLLHDAAQEHRILAAPAPVGIDHPVDVAFGVEDEAGHLLGRDEASDRLHEIDFHDGQLPEFVE